MTQIKSALTHFYQKLNKVLFQLHPFVLPLLFLLIPYTNREIWAQNPESIMYEDTSEFRNILDSAKAKLNLKDYPEVVKKIEPVYNFCKQYPDYTGSWQSESLILLGRAHFNLKNFIVVQSLFQDLISAHSQYLRPLDLTNVHILLMYSYNALDNKVLARDEMELSIRTYLRDDFSSLQKYETLELKTMISNLLQFGRIIRDSYNDYERAISVYEKTLFLNSLCRAAEPSIYTILLTDIGYTYFLLRKYDKADAYYQNAMKYALSLDSGYLSTKSYTYSLVGKNHLRQRQFEQAFTCFEIASNIMVGLGKTNSVEFVNYCNNFGYYYDSIQQPSKAIEYYNKALSLLQSNGKGKSEGSAILHLYIGRSQLMLGKFNQAISSFNEDLDILENLFGKNYYKLFYSLEGMGESYYNWFLESGEDSLRLKSLAYFERGFLLLRKFISESEDVQLKKLILSKSAAFCSKYLIALNSKSLQNIDAKANFNRSWEVSEFLHNSLLLQNILETAMSFKNSILDSAMLQQEKMKLRINELEYQCQETIQTKRLSNTDSSILKQKSYISFLKDSLKIIQNKTSSEFTAQEGKNVSLEAPSLNEIQNFLNPRQTLLEYFTTDTFLYIFLITNNRYEIKTIPLKASLKVLVNQFNEGIFSYQLKSFGEKPDYESTIEKYVSAATELYNYLIAPLVMDLTPELYIIPDGLLGSISFDALLHSKPENPLNFNTYSFLIKKYTITHHFSAATMLNMSEQAHSDSLKNNILAFAPFYDKNSTSLRKQLMNPTAVRYGLSELPYSGEELSKIQNHFNGNSKLFVGEEANKDNFLKWAPQFKIIHLATHGKANFEEGSFSFLAFKSKEKSKVFDLLTGIDFQSIHLHTELVVLSACETAVGEVNVGNGVISLSSAIASSGVKSILSTLWKVNDKSTMEIMNLFYQELKKGQPKDKAIQLSKLKYLQQSNVHAKHPFYWSGFQLYGNNRSLNL